VAIKRRRIHVPLSPLSEDRIIGTNPFGGEINDRGEAVGYSETDVPGPAPAKTFCGFGTHLTCSAFSLAKRPHERSPRRSAEITGQASAMNKPRTNQQGLRKRLFSGLLMPSFLAFRDSFAGDMGRRQRPELFVQWVAIRTGKQTPINDQGQAVGLLGNLHRRASRRIVGKKNGTAFSLPDLGNCGVPPPSGLTTRAKLLG